jgi:hypothetical protein
MMPEDRFNLIGPFVVENLSAGPYIGSRFRCYLATDADKKICFEGNSREMGEYFEYVCSTAQRDCKPSGGA